MAKNYSTEIAEAITDFLRSEDWNFEELNEENGIIELGVKLNSKLKKADIYINVLENGFIVNAVPQLSADKDCIKDMTEFITRANYGLHHGNFELDYRDGEIRYKTSLFIGDEIPTYDQIEAMIYISVKTLDRYGNGLAMVAFGMGTPEDAICMCEEQED
ncbi:MAG: YbjN domain-containing protein [Ruminococcus sp.]|nr:YbjN domain-containing protein [Ruminococcus sp.]MDE7226278.1 YbjN domain-containing protein [Ruminococcus sp.]